MNQGNNHACKQILHLIYNKVQAYIYEGLLNRSIATQMRVRYEAPASKDSFFFLGPLRHPDNVAILETLHYPIKPTNSNQWAS